LFSLDNSVLPQADPESKGKGLSFDEESMAKQVFGSQLKSKVI
jgi:hypothetical protein